MSKIQASQLIKLKSWVNKTKTKKINIINQKHINDASFRSLKFIEK